MCKGYKEIEEISLSIPAVKGELRSWCLRKARTHAPDRHQTNAGNFEERTEIGTTSSFWDSTYFRVLQFQRFGRTKTEN